MDAVIVEGDGRPIGAVVGGDVEIVTHLVGAAQQVVAEGVSVALGAV